MAFSGGAPAVVSSVLSLIAAAADSRNNTLNNQIQSAVNALAVAPKTEFYERLTTKIEDAKKLADTSVRLDRQLTLDQVRGIYGDEATATVLAVEASFDDFLAAQFPTTSAYVAQADAWLADQLTSGGTGINIVVEDQLWARERARTLRESARASDEAMSKWVGRGFTIPPGSLVHALTVIDREAAEKIGESSREQAINAFKVELDQVRFALSSSFELRAKAISASIEYMRATAMAGLEQGLKVAQNQQAAHQRLNDTLVEFYKTDIAGQDFTLKLRGTDQQYIRGKEDTDLGAKMTNLKLRTDAIMTGAQAQGNQAAAALNGMHANAQISGSDVTTTNL